MTTPPADARALRAHRSHRRPTGLCRQALTAALLAMGASHPAWATEAPESSLEELLQTGLEQAPRGVEVSVASRVSQSAALAPLLTHVVTAQDIQQFGLRTMADILRTLPGLYISTDGFFTYIGTRGLSRPSDYNTRLLFLLNGMRMNENVYDSITPGDAFPIDVRTIDRVEFAAGPGSALYGNNAFFGVVNIITQRADKQRGLSVQSHAADSGHSGLRVSHGHRLDSGAEWTASLTHFEGRRLDLGRLGLDDAPSRFHGALKQRNHARGQKFLAEFHDHGLDLQWGGHIYQRSYPVPYGTHAAPVFEEQRDVIRAGFLALRHELALNEHWDLTWSLARQSSTYDSRRPIYVAPGRIVALQFRGVGRWWNGDVRLSTEPFAGHRWVMGLDWQQDQEQSLSYNLSDEPEVTPPPWRGRRWGAYWQDEWRVNEGLTAVLGWRIDRSNRGQSHNPRLGLVWTATPHASLKMLYGSAYRSANLFEFGTNDFYGFPSPTPERLNTWELSWDHTLGQGLNYHVSAFRAGIRSLITLQPVPELNDVMYGNAQRVRSQGLTLGGDHRWSKGQQVQASVTWQQALDAQGQTLSNAPTWLLQARASTPLWRPEWRLGWQFQGMSRRIDLNGSTVLPAVGIHRLHLQWQASPQVEWGLTLHNAGDRRYQDPSSGSAPPLDQERRELRLTFTWRLPS